MGIHFLTRVAYIEKLSNKTLIRNIIRVKCTYNTDIIIATISHDRIHLHTSYIPVYYINNISPNLFSF